MNQVTSPAFGLLIAYLIPGFMALAGLSPHSPTVQAWLGTLPNESPSVGGFLYVTIASVAAGLTVSTVRWIILDNIHARTGLPSPDLDFSRLQENIDAYHAAVDYHYRYYQFYGGSIVSMLIVTVGHWPLSAAAPGLPPCLLPLGLLFTLTLFFFASRDTLKKYYERLSALTNPTSNCKEISDDQRFPSTEQQSGQQAYSPANNPDDPGAG